jgi:hypothetical protein
VATPFTNHLTVRFSPAEAFFTGKPSATLVPDVFPVAINGRAYMVDVKSGQYARGFEQRVRDSQDISTAPGESSISTGGLWRRGEASWHLGAGQGRADVADSVAYRFEESKGINVWTKGQLSLLNATKSALTSAATNLPMIEVNGYLYVGDNQTLKYTQNPYAATPSWTTVTGGPAAAINDITTDGSQIYVAYASSGIYMGAVGGASVAAHYATTSNTNYTKLGFGKGFVLGFHNDTSDSHIHIVPYATATSHGTPVAEFANQAFVCAGITGGQNAVYVAGRNTDRGVVYRLSLKSDGTTLENPIVALELPTGEYPTSILGYLGYILLGTNKGIRYCSTDSNANLVAGALIPTSYPVYDIAADDRFVWYTLTNYDGYSGGLGRLDLANFTGANTPAYATDLMYGTSAVPITATVLSVVIFNDKAVFSVSGVGVIAEDSANLVSSGVLTTGTYQWGIPDRKFIAKIDTRSRQLYGTIIPSISFDGGAYTVLSGQTVPLSYESTSNPPQTKFIEARLKFTLNRDSGAVGPTMTRWMARAYAAPARSEVFRVPVMVHSVINRWGTDYYFDVEEELSELRGLISDPRVVNYQEGTDQYSVIVEEVDFQQYDVVERRNVFEGTAIVTMRSV